MLPTITELLEEMLEKGASDLHLAAGVPPILRVDGNLIKTDYPFLTSDLIKSMVYALLENDEIERFEREKELDFSYYLEGISRFRGNLLVERDHVSAVFRAIPNQPFTIDELHLPEILKDFASRPKGLVVVTGPTGSGKSTTLAAMIDYINSNFSKHIITIEDPIEFMHRNKLSLVRQREYGKDTLSFSTALRYVLRQDPDVILVGEMRDLDTISLTITAAETGHLVLTTLHTTGAINTIDRIVDVFPASQQNQVRTQLSNILEGLISQTLLPRADGKGRVLAMEILNVLPSVRNIIRKGDTHQLSNIIQTGGKYGMVSFENYIVNLYRKGIITLETALNSVANPQTIKQLL